jgi:hypothetical protein
MRTRRSHGGTRHASDDADTLAGIRAYRGERDPACAWLDRAYARCESELGWVSTEPALRNLWDEPRFAAFLRKMNLPPPAARPVR